MLCKICGTPFDYPEYDADKALGATFGGTPGCHCDTCSQTIVHGSPEDLQRLLDTYFGRVQHNPT